MTMAKYQSKEDASTVVEAEQLTVETEIQVPGDIEKARPGDWLISDADGVQSALSDELFKATYKPLEETEKSDRSTLVTGDYQMEDVQAEETKNSADRPTP